MRRRIQHTALLLAGAGALTCLVFVVLVLPGWAGRNDAGPAHTLPAATRKPRAATVVTLAPAPDLRILATAAPTPAPRPAPPPTSPPQALTPYLAPIVERYGIDPGRRFVVVDPNLQRMTIWDPGQPLREFDVSTGDVTQGWRTAAWYGLVGRYVGTFQAFGVYADDAWYLFRDAGDILIHSAPYHLVEGVKRYEDLAALGSYPASRGCIRLHPADAAWFTAWQPEGVPLVILPRDA